MAITLAEVEHVAQLARLRLTPEELARMQEQLSAILDYIEMLHELDVEGVPPTTQITGLPTLLREDEVQPAFAREQVLANAPDQHDGMFRIKGLGLSKK